MIDLYGIAGAIVVLVIIILIVVGLGLLIAEQSWASGSIVLIIGLLLVGIKWFIGRNRKID